MAIIKEEEIVEQIKVIETETAGLRDSIAEYTSTVDSLSEVIAGLNMCLNTTGGKNRVSNISSIEFDTATANTIAENSDVIVEYSQVKTKI